MIFYDSGTPNNPDAIVNVIMNDLNLTSAAAVTRVGGWVNRAYRQLASDFSIRTIEEQLGILVPTVIGAQTITVGTSTTTPSVNVEKVIRVFNPANNPSTPVTEVSVDEIQNSVLGTDPVQRYAVLGMGAKTVTLLLDCVPASIYNLSVDCLVNLATLTGTAVPAFTEDFHNLLVYKGKQLELEKMEKYALAEKQEAHYNERLGEYRLYLALSEHRKIYSGKTLEQGSTINARI